MSDYACNVCADKAPETYPAECRTLRAKPGELLECEVCGNRVPLLNIPALTEEDKAALECIGSAAELGGNRG